MKINNNKIRMIWLREGMSQTAQKRDGDGEMMRDTGVGGGDGGDGDRRSLSVLADFCRVYDPLSPPPSVFFYLPRRDASPSLTSSALRSAPGVTPFPPIRK